MRQLDLPTQRQGKGSRSRLNKTSTPNNYRRRGTCIWMKTIVLYFMPEPKKRLSAPCQGCKVPGKSVSSSVVRKLRKEKEELGIACKPKNDQHHVTGRWTSRMSTLVKLYLSQKPPATEEGKLL